jgi:tRNA nucleotidyltransferase/poly(A) polymerase
MMSKIELKLFKVGGCVRDGILGIKSKDIDYSVVISGLEYIEDAFQYLTDWLFANDYEIFLSTPECLTIRARKGKEVADFVLARKEVGYIPGTRQPIVEVGTLYDDLLRRDFTFNALAIGEDGELIDMFGGLEDLHNRILRTPLPAMQTFTDDPLRVLRAIRFRIKYGCVWPVEMQEAIENPILPQLMSVVSTDRIRDELSKAMAIDSFATLKLLASLPDALVKVWLGNGLWLMPTTKDSK